MNLIRSVDSNDYLNISIDGALVDKLSNDIKLFIRGCD